MSSFTNEGTFGMSFAQGDIRKQSGHYPSASLQQDAPIIDNLSVEQSYWTDDPYQESYVPASVPSNMGSWSSTHAGPYEGDLWSGNQHFDEAHLGTWYDTPGDNVDEPRMDFGEVAGPIFEQAFPAAQNALPAFQPFPPSIRSQTPNSLCRSTPSWDHPVYTPRQSSDCSNPIGPFGMQHAQISPNFQLTASSPTTGHRERTDVTTSGLPSVAATKSVHPLASSDPVPVPPSTLQPRGERWGLSNAVTYRCMWMSANRETRCAALVAGDRRSVTSHLRDKHNFSCDGQMVACAWHQCMASMQRRNIPRHIIACHFGVKVPCPQCGMRLSRADAGRKHQIACMRVNMPAVVEASEENEGGYCGVGMLSHTK